MRPDKVQTVRRKPLQTRTRLEVLRGVPPIDSDVVGLDEDTNKHKSLDIDSTGVEHEDAKEEHLVQALAATRRQFESGSVASSSSSNVQIAIPIPNATASVENWEDDYPANQWHDPHAFVQSSDAVEQSIAGFPSKGYSYDMDEKDDAWLRAHNAAVKGEGTSATGARLGKKGAPAVPVPSFVISEDEFEMTMALFEKFTDDMYPYLEVDVSKMPAAAEFENSFAEAVRPSAWASMQIPDSCRDPVLLVRLSRAIHPWWSERKARRKGKKIIPQLLIPATVEDSDPFGCFRPREVKTARKTRRSEQPPVDKLLKLKLELSHVVALSDQTSTREEMKTALARESLNVFESRMRLYEQKRKYPQIGTPQDDTLLIEPERVPKRPRLDTSSNVVKISRKLRDGVELASAMTPVLVPEITVPLINPLREAASIQLEVDRMCEERRKSGWENGLDLRADLPSGSPSIADFHPVDSLRTKLSETSISRPSPAVALRVRAGRGGIVHLDRQHSRGFRGSPRVPPFKPTDLKSLSYKDLKSRDDFVVPDDLVFPRASGRPPFQAREELDEEQIRILEERARYDDDYSVADEEHRVVVDDYDERYLATRVNTYSVKDFYMLRGDDSHLVRVNTKINEVQTQALRPLIVQRNQWIAQITEKRAAMAQEEKARAALAQAKAAAGGEDPPAPPPTGSSNAPGAPPNPNPTSIPNSNLPPRSVPPPNALPTPAEPPRSSSGSTQSSAADSLDAAFAARPSTPLTNNHPAPPSSASSSSSVSPSTPSLGEQMTGPQPIIAGQAMGQQSLGISQLMQQHKQRQMQLAMNGMPQSSTPLTQQQLNHLQAMQQAQARLYAQQVPVQNGGPAPGLGAQNGASPHLSAAAIAGARSSPSMMHNAATSEMSPPHAHAIARPASQQQNGNQIIAPQSNPGFPMPQYVYQQQLAHQAAQANGAVPSAPAPAQPTSAQMQFLAAAANPNHPAHLQYKQIMMQQINSVNAANGHGGPHPNGVPNGMLPQGHPQYAHLAQHGGMKVAPGMMPPQQPSHPQQPMQGQMWAAPTMPTPNAVNAAMQAAGIPTTTNMQLKLPPGRQPQPQPQQPQWHGTPMDKAAFLAAHGQGSLLGVESMGAPSQSPVIQHAAAIGSPMMTAARNYPRGVSGSPIMQPGASPVMDHQQHPHMMGTPQMMNRQQMAPSPLGGMPYQSPHLG